LDSSRNNLDRGPPRVLMAVRPDLLAKLFPPQAMRRLRRFAEVSLAEEKLTEQGIAGIIGDFDALVTSWGSPMITPELVSKARRLRIICHAAGSIRPYVCPEAFDAGITVTNAASAIAVSVAEATLCLILNGLRGFHVYDGLLRSGETERPSLLPERELRSRIVGIVGAGEVGRRVIDLVRSFGCRILVFDPYKSQKQIHEMGAEPSSLERLFEECDVISLHAPNIPQNRHMIGRKLIRSMRDGALLVNTARGEIVDEEALIDELLDGRIRAAIDVFERPVSEIASRLAECPNVILTPHVAGRTVDSRKRQGETVVEDLRLFFQGKKPRNVVTKDMLSWMA